MTIKATVADSDCCPTCSDSENWKRPKLIIMSGTVEVDTESDGGGWGVGAGFGRGHGGVGVNYQGMELKTTGTHVTALANAYQPPTPPQEYEAKDYWQKEWKDAVVSATKVVKEAAAHATTGRVAGFLSGVSDEAIERARSTYSNARSVCQKLADYEADLKRWETSRVCGRCGTLYITKHDFESIDLTIKIPPPDFIFEGMDQRCPCGSYMWTSDLYESNMGRQALVNGLESAKDWVERLPAQIAAEKWNLEQAEIEAMRLKAEKPSLLGKLKRKLFPPPDPEAIRTRIAKHELDLVRRTEQLPAVVAQYELMLENLERARANNHDLDKSRTCRKCHQQYILRKKA